MAAPLAGKAALLSGTEQSKPADAGAKAAGGPDTYGYRYMDNDDGDSAAYRWVDTASGIWTTVQGIGDDNAVGPFPLGFEFPYYWYRVSQFWVHANGGISFSLPSRSWTPQNAGDEGFPNLQQPQDLIGVIGLDLDLTAGGKCMYRLRTAAPESLIVSWLNVPRWGTTDIYTGQLILARADSTIRVQIQTATNPPNNIGSMGIENSGGNIGLSYFTNGTPPQNRLHGSLAIKYYPPAVSAYAATDAGVVAVINPQSGAKIVHTGDALQPWAIVKNFGTTDLAALKAVCRIRNSAGTVVFTDSLLNIAVPKAQQLPITFSSSFVPAVTGTYRAVIRTYQAESPANSSNDSMVVELPVVNYQQWASYDDGTRDAWGAWSGTGPTNPTGFGNYFEVSRFPVTIDSVQMYINHSAGNILWVQICDTTGEMGGPGKVLAADTIVFTTTVTEWVKLSYVSRNVEAFNGKFYVCYKTPSAGLKVGLDRSAPISRRTWEYNGGWSVYRATETNDAMIRANCRSSVYLTAFYVDSTDGNDANTGSSTAPFKTVNYALNRLPVSATDTIYVRNGTYNEAVNILPAHSGTNALRHVLAAQAGHAPLIKPNGAAATLVDSGASYFTIKGLTIFPGTGQMSAVLTGASNDSFCNNTVYTPTMGYSILLMSQTSSAVKGNKVLPLADNLYPAEGIFLYSTDGVTVDSNQVSGMIDAGIGLVFADNTLVTRNVSSQCMFGIDMYGSSGVLLYNNTFDSNINSGIHVQSVSGTLVIRNTNSTNSIYGICWDSTGAVSSDYNNIWNNTYNYKNPQLPGDTNIVAPGAHDISVDPLYAAGYILQGGSPCIDAGTPVGLPSVGLPDIGAFEAGMKGGQLSLEGSPSSTEKQFRLLGSHPNPFIHRTSIRYQIQETGMVSLKIYNISGQLVRTLVNGFHSPGRHDAVWDGRDGNGRLVSSGLYYSRLESGGKSSFSRMTLIK